VTTMGMLRRGDEKLHYSDSSHRWIAPPSIEQRAWEAKLRAHLNMHLTTMDGRIPASPKPRIPRQRSGADSDRIGRSSDLRTGG